MKIAVSELTKKYKAVLATSGASANDVEGMARLYLEQDFHNNYFSGLWETENVIKELQRSIGKQQSIEVDKPALKLVNCNGRSTGLVSLDLVRELCSMAKVQGIAIIGLYNGGYQSMPEVFARAMATFPSWLRPAPLSQNWAPIPLRTPSHTSAVR